MQSLMWTWFLMVLTQMHCWRISYQLLILRIHWPSAASRLQLALGKRRLFWRSLNSGTLLNWTLGLSRCACLNGSSAVKPMDITKTILGHVPVMAKCSIRHLHLHNVQHTAVFQKVFCRGIFCRTLACGAQLKIMSLVAALAGGHSCSTGCQLGSRCASHRRHWCHIFCSQPGTVCVSCSRHDDLFLMHLQRCVET